MQHAPRIVERGKEVTSETMKNVELMRRWRLDSAARRHAREQNKSVVHALNRWRHPVEKAKGQKCVQTWLPCEKRYKAQGKRTLKAKVVKASVGGGFRDIYFREWADPYNKIEK